MPKLPLPYRPFAGPTASRPVTPKAYRPQAAQPVQPARLPGVLVPPVYRPQARGPIQLMKKGNPIKAAAAAARAVPKVREPLKTKYGGHQTVHTEEGYRLRFKGKDTVDITCQLDSFQGKHDLHYSNTVDGARENDSAGSQVDADIDYATLAAGVPIELLVQKAALLAAKEEHQPFDFSVQKKLQRDGLKYEISAQWETLDGGIHILVYYHCYPG